MFIQLNDVQYHVQVVGEGEPLLLLHGFTGSLTSWSIFIDEWSKKFKLILVDLMGHGKTDYPLDYHRYSTENAVRDLEELLNKLEISKIHILGYSMGGRLALSFAVLFPERVVSLLLESSSPGLQLEEERTTRRNSDTILAEKIEQAGVEVFIDYWETIPLFTTQNERLPAYKKQALREGRLQNNAIGLANSLRGMGTGMQPSWWNHLPSIHIPTLLLAGELDEKFCSINRMMNRKFPNSELLIVNDAGHTIHLEQPEFFGKIIMDYISKKFS